MNYSQLYKKVTKGLSPKTKNIFDRRFGVASGKVETLESIGNGLGITRERVRQIEEAGFKFVRKNYQDTLDNVFAEFAAYFQGQGGFKKEEMILEDLGGKKNKPHVLFFLTIGEGKFSRVCEKKDYYYFWSTLQNAEAKVKDTLNALVLSIKAHGSPLQKNDLVAKFALQHSLSDQAIESYLEVSKKIQSNKEGNTGLIDWPEIRPRSVKDKALLVFKKHQKPLHFREITQLIDQLNLHPSNKKTHPQTVHNELIKDARFVLVGRGMYALGEWGYVPGTIKDIIANVLKEKPHLVRKDDIVKEVLSQRFVEKNTVLINLNDKKYFKKNAEGKYFAIERQTA